MIRTASRALVFALTLAMLTGTSVRATAQSNTTPQANPNPSVVTGTDPEPQDDIIIEILSMLFFA